MTTEGSNPPRRHVVLAQAIGGRKVQEDSLWYQIEEEVGLYFLVVCDGAGGHGGGKDASKTAIDSARRMWSKRVTGPLQAGDFEGEDWGQFLTELTAKANSEIKEMNAQMGKNSRSTFVALVVDGSTATWAHAGDSRLYRFADGVEEYRTEDHSVPQMLLDRGKITKEELGDHPDQNRLLRGLGGNHADPDVSTMDDVDPTHSFLLCSDGFWTTLEGPGNTMRSYDGDPQTVPARIKKEILGILEQTNNDGDNISVAFLTQSSDEKIG